MDGFLCVVGCAPDVPKAACGSAPRSTDPYQARWPWFLNKDDHLATHITTAYRYYANLLMGIHQGWRPFRRRWET